MKFLRDLFCGVHNQHWELGRIMGGFSVLSMFAAVGWNIHLRQAIDLQAFGTGLAAVVGASAVLIAAKDWARSRNCPPGGGS